MSKLAAYLSGLHHDAETADAVETAFRREAAARMATLAAARTIAYRRANLIQAIAESVSSAESEEMAVAIAQAHLRIRLGWSTDSEMRDEVLLHFASVAQAVFNAARDVQETVQIDPGAALSTFETWYAETRMSLFWTLFDQDIPETPRVDF